MKPDETLFTLQKLIVQFAHIERNHYRAQSERHEDDIDHSFAVALLCWYLVSRHNLKLNLEKVLRYALIHDFVEVHAGDVNSFATPEERAAKTLREKAALVKLTKELPTFTQLTKDIDDYEDRDDEESLFVWTVDKMQALIMGELDGWRPYKNIGVSYEAFTSKHREQISVCSPHLRTIFQDLFAYCLTTYYDQR